ncbi:U32 family peptidase [Acutalibacter sp. 1XD8-33]|nr:U32 family peptidase [Acutalibacter sp. 1XD8-33]
MNRAVEILAPAGGWPALEAAVRAGADAVYLAGPSYGARASAQNFSREELAEAVQYCHGRGVRVHVTVNILLKDREIPEALEFVEFLCSLPVDAVLVQDMGLFALLRRQAPELPLHASTQMSLHTPAGTDLLCQLGAARVVLARELSLSEIREIADRCPVELEAFVHGALCMSVSGQCYLSAAFGGREGGARSGNRGRCAQPCRLPFAAPGGPGCALSLKDLSFIRRMPLLAQAGVCSAKIEGRMKRPEYVAAAAAACRLAADGQPIPPDLLQDLEAVFSRSGFTEGYLRGKRGREMFGVRRKEDVTAATEKVLGKLRNLYRAESRRVPVSFTLEETGGQVLLTVRDPEGRETRTSAHSGEFRLPKERCEEQLKKTGGTPFFPEETVVPPEGVRLSVAALNRLRREVLEGLLLKRQGRKPIPFSSRPYDLPPHQKAPASPRVRVSFRALEQLCPEALECPEICLPVETKEEELLALREKTAGKILLDLPRGFFGREQELRELMGRRMARGFTEFLCGNLGSLALCQEMEATAHGGPSLNITNTAALEAFARLGLASAQVSPELTGREAEALGGALPRGIEAYGRQALMLTRNCPLANSPKGCLGCQTPGFLTDRRGVAFPVVCRQGGQWCAELLNSVPLWLGDLQKEFLWADFAVLRFTVESPVECGQVLGAWQKGKPLEGSYTRGLFRRGVE